VCFFSIILPTSTCSTPLLTLTLPFSRWSTLHCTYLTCLFILHSSSSSLVDFTSHRHLYPTISPSVAGRLSLASPSYFFLPLTLSESLVDSFIMVYVTLPPCLDTLGPGWLNERFGRSPTSFLQRKIDEQVEPLQDELWFTRKLLFENEQSGHFLERLQAAEAAKVAAEGKITRQRLERKRLRLGP